MIRSLLTFGAAATLGVLLVGCSESDPAASGRDKGPRAAPTTAQPAPDLPSGSDKAQSGSTGGGGARGTTGTGGGG